MALQYRLFNIVHGSYLILTKFGEEMAVYSTIGLIKNRRRGDKRYNY